MQQASILMTFFVGLMGAAYLGLETGAIDAKGFLADPPPVSDTAVAQLPAVQPAV
jgi:hypothetical protein